MKKFILGISMFLGGIIGAVGWMISCAIINQNLSGFELIEVLYRSDLIIFVIFVVMTLVGLVISFLQCRKE